MYMYYVYYTLMDGTTFVYFFIQDITSTNYGKLNTVCVCVFVIEKHSHNSGLIVKKNIVVLVVVVCLFGKLFRNLN